MHATADPRPGGATPVDPPGGPLRAAEIGEAHAIAPDTFVVPGWWPSPQPGLGLQVGTLLVRGAATAVVDTGLSLLGADWISTVCSLADPADIRWVVLTGPDRARTGNLALLRETCPEATVVAAGRGCVDIDLGGRALRLLTTRSSHLSVHVPDQDVLWTDLMAGPFDRPSPDLAGLTDDEALAALALRSPQPDADRIERLSALGPRVLASPLGPVARGAQVARAFDLVRRAADGPRIDGATLGTLIASCGPRPLEIQA